jgi:hypothetical protein
MRIREIAARPFSFDNILQPRLRVSVNNSMDENLFSGA